MHTAYVLFAPFLATIASAGRLPVHKPYNCAATKDHPMLKAFNKPQYSAEAKAFCSDYIKITKTAIKEVTQTVQDVTTTVPATVVEIKQVTSTVYSESTRYTSVAHTISRTTIEARSDLPAYPTFIPSNKPDYLVKAACKCIVSPVPKTTVTSEVTVSTVTDFTSTITQPAPVSTSTVTVATVTAVSDTVDGGEISCGVLGELFSLVGSFNYFEHTTFAQCMAVCDASVDCNYIATLGEGGLCYLFRNDMSDVIDDTFPGGFAFYDRRCKSL